MEMSCFIFENVFGHNMIPYVIICHKKQMLDFHIHICFSYGFLFFYVFIIIGICFLFCFVILVLCFIMFAMGFLHFTVIAFCHV